MKKNWKQLNDETNERLENWKSELTDKAYAIIGLTDYNCLHEMFGDLETPKEVNDFVEEFYNEFFDDEE